MKLRKVKIDFLISPAYCVPPISTTPLEKSIAITVVERHPCRNGSARKEGKIQNRQLRLETTRALNRGEKMPRKERMPGVFGQNPNIQPMRWRGAGIEILSEERHTTRVRQHVLMQSAKLLRRHRKIVVPPDRRLGQRVADDKFVVRRSPRVGAGFHDESARRGCDSLAASDRFSRRVRSSRNSDAPV